jgi:hypothetical protein
LEQAQANLGYLLAHREARLSHLTRFLSGFNVEVAAALRGGPFEAPLNALHEWTKQEFPRIYDPQLAKREVWVESSRTGAEIVYSLMMDIALLLGELVVTRRQEYSWSLDLDPDNEADQMTSHKRAVVQLPKGEPFPAPIIFDFEAIVVSHFFNVSFPDFGLIDMPGQQVRDAISGAYERPWRKV